MQELQPTLVLDGVRIWVMPRGEFEDNRCGCCQKELGAAWVNVDWVRVLPKKRQPIQRVCSECWKKLEPRTRSDGTAAQQRGFVTRGEAQSLTRKRRDWD